MQRRRFLTALGLYGAAGLARAADPSLLLAQAAARTRSPDVIFVPTPNDVVNKMLEMAKVTAKDVVYDLGCGIRPYEPDILSVAERYVGVDWSNTHHALRADVIADLNERLPVDDGVADLLNDFFLGAAHAEDGFAVDGNPGRQITASLKERFLVH